MAEVMTGIPKTYDLQAWLLPRLAKCRRFVRVFDNEMLDYSLLCKAYKPPRPTPGRKSTGCSVAKPSIAN